MRLIALFTAAAFGLVAVTGLAHAQATNVQQKSDSQMMESGSTTSKKAVKSTKKRMKKSSKKSM